MRTPLLTGAVLASFSLISCSNFEERWEEAIKNAAPSPQADSMIGAWKGKWLSNSNGHTGGLRLLVSKNGEGEDYIASYHATWGSFLELEFEFELPMAVTVEDGEIRFAGAANLIPWGNYTYDGTAKDGEFRANYDSALDKGTFELEYVRAGEGEAPSEP